MDFNELPSELREQAKACKSEEELSALLEKADIKLSVDEIEGEAGGAGPAFCQHGCLVDLGDPCPDAKF